MLTSLLFALSLLTPPDSALRADHPVELDPIIVVGKREPVRLSRAVNSALYLSPQRVAEAPSENLLEVLPAADASITVTSVRGIGYGLGPAGQGKLLIRGLGFSPNRGTLVLTDGRPDIASLFGHPLPDTYLRAGIYTAELVKGGASTLYGSNALGGVLDIQSFYRPDRPRYTNVEFTGGSWATRDIVLQHSVHTGGAVLAGWAEYLESDNERPNSTFINRGGGFRAQFNEKGRWRSFLSGKYVHFDFSDPGPTFAPARSTGDIKRAGLTFGTDYRSERFALTGRLFTNYGEHAFSNGFHSVDRNHGLDVFARLDDVFADGLAVSGGVSVNNFGGSAYDGTPAIRQGDFGVWEYAANLQFEYDQWDWLNLTAGGRFVRHDAYGGHFTYQAGAVLTPGRVGSFKASIATAYRNPTISELYLLPPANADSLKPEEGTFYEVGWFKRFGRVVSVEAASFWRTGENLIVVVPPPPPPPRFVNSGRFSHWGFEAKVRLAFGDWWVQPSFIHLNQKELNNSVPDDKFALMVRWRSGPLGLGLESVAAFNTHSDSAGVPVVLADYVVTNVHADYRLGGVLKLRAVINNLFDTEYQTVAGYPMPGINFRLGIGAVFE